MIRRSVLMLICFVFAGYGTGTVFAQEAGSGTAQESNAAGDQYEFDFGTIPGSKPVSHEFTLVNTSDRIMHITGKTNSCGCVRSAIDTETVLPAGHAIVKVTFNPAAYHGEIQQYVYVNTDDPEHEVYKFTVKADVGQ